MELPAHPATLPSLPVPHTAGDLTGALLPVTWDPLESRWGSAQHVQSGLWRTKASFSKKPQHPRCWGCHSHLSGKHPTGLSYPRGQAGAKEQGQGAGDKARTKDPKEQQAQGPSDAPTFPLKPQHPSPAQATTRSSKETWPLLTFTCLALAVAVPGPGCPRGDTRSHIFRYGAQQSGPSGHQDRHRPCARGGSHTQAPRAFQLVSTGAQTVSTA